MKDPAFLDDARKRSIEINPLSGAETSKLMTELYQTPRDVVDEARRATEAQQH
jgi:hypothetical protein